MKHLFYTPSCPECGHTVLERYDYDPLILNVFSFNPYTHSPCLFRSAQQRALCDNELLHFHDRWKMRSTPSAAPPFPPPLRSVRLGRPSTCRPSRRPGAASYQMIGMSQREEEEEEEEVPGVEAVEKPLHTLHQYCSLTW